VDENIVWRNEPAALERASTIAAAPTRSTGAIGSTAAVND
jgi:hypothetical protein